MTSPEPRSPQPSPDEVDDDRPVEWRSSRRLRAPIALRRDDPHTKGARREPTPTELLAFEAEYGAHSSLKEVRILDVLGIRPARFYQLLSRAVLDPAAVAAHPITARQARGRFERKTR